MFEDFYETFDVGSVINKKELASYVSKYYDNIKPITLAWRIFDLKNEGYIRDIGNTYFKVVDKQKSRIFSMSIDTKIHDFLTNYNKKFSVYKKNYYDIDIEISVWESHVLNQFMSHQMYKNFIMIEVNEARIDHLFFEMKEHFNDVVPIGKITGFDYFSYNLQNIIIIQKLPKRSPTNATIKNDYVSVPKAEKILVDLVVYNKDIFNIDYMEVLNIYEGILNKYRVSITTLLSYARIRGVRIKDQVLMILHEIGVLEDDR